MALIRVENLSKTYITGKNIETPALRDINLTIDDRDFVALAGTSGSGKTTLLNLLGSLDKPSSGSIFYEQQNIAQLNEQQVADFRLNQVGFIFQAYNLINTLTALENVEYIMLLQGVPAAERLDRSRDILKRVGIEKYINNFPNQMSGGQQQRVAVARAIVARPKVILADEPTANLDSRTAENLLDLMLELNQERQTTFVFSTHDPMVMDKVKRIVKLKDGEIIS